MLIKTKEASGEVRAGDRARTGDNQLGRLKLYQLSYSRISTNIGHFHQISLFLKSCIYKKRVDWKDNQISL